MKKVVLQMSLVLTFAVGFSSCGEGEKSTKKEVTKKVEKEIPLKIGDKYEGGYIFFLDFDGKHGKICAPRFEGDGKEVIHSEAVVGVKNLKLNGYSDWRLPSMDELNTILNLKRNDLFGFVCESGYWTNDKGNEIGDYWIKHIPSDASSDGNTYSFGGEYSPEFSCRYKVVRDF